MYVKVLGVQGKEIRLLADDKFDLNKLLRFSNGKQPTGELLVDDHRHITRDQQKKIFALIHDLCSYTGDEPKRWENEFKWRVEITFDVDEFSLSDCSMTVGNYMILTILDFLFEENIPFKTKLWDSLPSDFPRQRLCLKNRTCVICGRQHADLAHFKAVGMGRNRRKIDERKMYFMTLCRQHHQEQHRIGINNFMKRYHLKPIRLSDNDLIRFKILSKQRLEELKDA